MDALGITRGRTRRRDITRPYHGVWTAEGTVAGIIARCREYEPLLISGQMFSHGTALALYGAPVQAEATLHLSVLFPRTPPRGRGIRGHSLRCVEPRTALGLPAPAAAWAEAAAHFSREDLVALGDHLLTHRLASLDELEAAHRARFHSPGSARAAWALPRIRSGSRSRPESLLRVAVVEAGLPEPMIEHPIVVDGGLVLHPDLAFVRERVVLEYEGDGHRTDREVWRRDLHRRELLEAAGWRVVRVTADDLFRGLPAFLARLRVLLAARASQ